MRPTRPLLLLALAAWPPAAAAAPPLVIGDVPTADPGTVEVYAGVERERSGGVAWSVPATEVVVGVSRWQEVTLEVPYRAVDGRRGPGDVVLGTKLLLLSERAERPGLAASVDWKLASGDRAEGLGSGAMELGALLRAQRSIGRATLFGNAGYTLVGEPRVAGVRQPRRDTGFLGAGAEVDLGAGVAALADLYWRSVDVAGAPARVAADLGLAARLRDHLAVHGAAGTSLRRASLGGPQLRLYLGLKGELQAL